MDTTNLNKNLALALCLSSVLLAPQAIAEAATITGPIDQDVYSIGPNNVTQAISDDLDITTVGSNAVRASANGPANNLYFTLDITGDVIIKNTGAGYALLAENTASSGITTLNINPNQDKTVQIIGNLKASTASVINVNLINDSSYLAGNTFGDVALTLKEGATWYPKQDTIALVGGSGGELKALYADGGIIDIYHSQPNVVRTGSGARTVTIQGINDSNGGARGATFRISSDIAAGTADKIVLMGDALNTAAASNNYYIQVVQDPGMVVMKDTVLKAGSDIVVAELYYPLQINNTNIVGTSYRTSINAGLSIAEITPQLQADALNLQYLLKELDIKVSGDSGPAMLMAASGAAAAQAAAAAWRADNNDLMRRMGDLRNAEGESGAWGKIYGGQVEVQSGHTKLDYRAVQVGYDRQHQTKSGKLFTGLTLSHLRGDTSAAAGNGDLNSTMFGIYGSYVGDRGHFADLIIKYGRMNNKIATIAGADSYSGEYGSNGISISAEYGYRHNLKHNVYIEPQVELTYNNLGGSNYTMSMNGGAGAQISNEAYKSLIGRIGFTLGKQYKNNNVYLKLGMAHEFQGGVGLNASYGGLNIPYNISGKSTWMEYGVGFNVMTNKHTNFYAELEKTTGSVVRTNWRGHLGMRYSF